MSDVQIEATFIYALESVTCSHDGAPCEVVFEHGAMRIIPHDHNTEQEHFS